jgi:hypothetical protein
MGYASPRLCRSNKHAGSDNKGHVTCFSLNDNRLVCMFEGNIMTQPAAGHCHRLPGGAQLGSELAMFACSCIQRFSTEEEKEPDYGSC